VSSTIPADLVAHVLCVDATAQTDGASPSCTEYLPNVQQATAPTALMGLAEGTFVVPAAPAYQAEAQTAGAFLGLPVWPDMISYLDNDLAGIDTSTVHVFLVIGDTTTTTCTVPGCTTPSTIPVSVVGITPGPQLDARVAEWVNRAGPALAALGFPTIEHKTDSDGVTKISASDPARPTDRNITITIRAGVAEVTPTTYSASQRAGSIALKYQANDGWLYEIELVDTASGPLPTEAQLLDIVTTLGN
jgi:hypothetical protein